LSALRAWASQDSTLALLVPRIGANDTYNTFALDDLAMAAYFFYRSQYFHFVLDSTFNLNCLYRPEHPGRRNRARTTCPDFPTEMQTCDQSEPG